MIRDIRILGTPQHDGLMDLAIKAGVSFLELELCLSCLYEDFYKDI